MKYSKFNKFYINNKKKIIFFGIIFIIILSLWFLLNFSLNLFLNSSPIIKIEPNQLYLSLLNNETKIINYNITVDKPFYLDINCNYSFVDISKNTILANSQIDLNNPINFLSFTISPESKGSGKKIYNLEVLCSENDNSSLEKTVYEKTSFLLLSYELTSEEKILKENLRPQLLEAFKLYNNVSRKSNEINFLLLNNIDLISYSIFLNKSYNLNLELGEDYFYLNNLEKLWLEENYVALNRYNINKYIINLQNLDLDYIKLYDDILINIEIQNDNVGVFNQSFKSYLEVYNDSLKYKDKFVFYNLLFDDSIILNDYYTSIYQSYKFDKYISNLEFERDLIFVNNLRHDFNNSLNEIRNNFSLDSKVFLIEENKIRCDIGNCLSSIFLSNFSNNTCVSIFNLISNKNYNEYNLSEDFILVYDLISYNNTYYDYVNGSFEIFNINYLLNSSNENESIENLNINKKILNLNSNRYLLENNDIKIKPNLDLKTFYINYCYVNKSLKINTFNFSNLTSLNYINFKPVLINKENITDLNSKFDLEIAENLPQCCVGGICANCCINEDCKQNSKTYPVLLIHGHSFVKSSPAEPSINSFDKVSYKLIEDGFIDAGVLSFTNLTLAQSNLGSLNAPVSVKASYYYDSFYDLGGYVYITKKNDNIDTYAIRLSEIVNSLKVSTGRPKVNIVAHSMGGLVVRRYMQIFGTDSVDKVILIGTPNHGVSGRVKYLCSVVGEKLECEDMADDSILIAKLNDPNYKPNVDLYTISGIGCDMGNGLTGDGVVSINSSQLSYATNVVVNGTCSDLFSTNLHTDLININKYPKVYEYIQDILIEK